MQPYNLETPSSIKEIRKLRKDANAMIIDEKTKKRYLRKLNDDQIPSDSFEKEYKDKNTHILGRTLTGELWTIIPHLALVANQSPLDLWIAKHCAAEVRETYGLSSSAWQKVKIGIFVGLIIAIIVVTFLIVSTASGGTVA